jgi:ABC-2 type transport system permease protein
VTADTVWRAFAAQARVELLLTVRRFENLVITLAVPVVLLVFLATVRAVPAGPAFPGVNELVPRVLAVALIGTGLVSLGIVTAYERGYGVLKRLAGSPLPTWALLGSKALAVAVTVSAQIALLVVAGLLLGWSPADGPIAAVAGALPWIALGIVVFASLGLLLAGTLRPEAVLAAANGLYLVLILLGGVIVPVAQLPQPVSSVAALLPSALLANALTSAMAPDSAAGPDPVALGGLVVWALALSGAALVTFRVE